MLLSWGGVAGAAITSVPLYIKYAKNNTNDNEVSQLSSHGISSRDNEYPQLSYYPVTHANDLYHVFMYVFQTIMPKLRALPGFQENEYKLFKEMLENKFFFLANEYVMKLRKSFKDNMLIVPKDREVGRRILSQSIKEYPEGWAKVIHLAITSDPDIMKAFSVQGD